MLLGQSTAEYVLIKAVIYAFSYLGLLCLLYFYLALAIGGVRWIAHPVSIIIETIGAIEILFYLFWFLPYRHYLHKQRPSFPPRLTREERQDLFFKSLAATPDIELFAKKWMCGASLEELRRENLKEWMLWALFDREGPPGADDEELEAYIETIEEVMGRTIKPGWGPVESLRLNFQRFEISHRSLVYYGFIGFADFVASMTLLFAGFRFYRQPRSKFLRSFPFRVLTLLSPKQSASPNLSYFYRPHKSSKHRPIVLVHGVGIGLSIYIPFMLMLPKDVGILAIEVLPVSSRICEGAPSSIDLMREAGDIISQQNLTDFVFIGHSYGTFFAKLFTESNYLATRMSKIILIDPVAVLLHLPDVAYNFTKKKPMYANEWQLWWAAQTELDIAFTFAKRLCWRSHILWREDLLKHPTTIVLGGIDCLVDSAAIAAYITRDVPETDATSIGTKLDLQWTWEDRERWIASVDEWTGEDLELVWLEGYDHGQGLLGKKMLPRIVKMVQRYCEKDLPSKDDDDTGSRVEMRREEGMSPEFRGYDPDRKSQEQTKVQESGGNVIE